MTLDVRSKYPTRRAYVLKMRIDAGPEALVGRLENLVTGKQLEFASGRELLDAIAAELSTGADASATGGDRRTCGLSPGPARRRSQR